MYDIEEGNTRKLSMIFKNVSNGQELVQKAED